MLKILVYANFSKLWNFPQLPDFIGILNWFKEESHKIHVWQAQKQEKEEICILIMFKSQYSTVNLIIFTGYLRFLYAGLW